MKISQDCKFLLYYYHEQELIKLQSANKIDKKKLSGDIF